jgi:hypothetical protein
VSCQSKGIAAVTIPLRPPITKTSRNPSANSIGVFRTGRPCQSVATHASTCTALKMEIVMLAALKKLIAICVMPVANM